MANIIIFDRFGYPMDHYSKMHWLILLSLSLQKLPVAGRDALAGLAPACSFLL